MLAHVRIGRFHVSLYSREARQEISFSEQQVEFSQGHEHQMSHTKTEQQESEDDNTVTSCQLLILTEELQAKTEYAQTYQNQQEDGFEEAMVDDLGLQLIRLVEAGKHYCDEAE